MSDRLVWTILISGLAIQALGMGFLVLFLLTFRMKMS